MQRTAYDTSVDGPAAAERRLKAVVHADVVGYSRLIGMDDVGTTRRLRALRREVIDPAILARNGEVVNTAGDAMLILFNSVDDAVQCAVRWQQETHAYEREIPPQCRISFRIGINIGDVAGESADVYGDGVNVAARLESVCPAGEICVSRSVRDHVRAQLGMAFQPLGQLKLKNIAQPVEAFVLHPNGAGGALRGRGRRKTIVLAGLLVLIFPIGAGLWCWPLSGVRHEVAVIASRLNGSQVSEPPRLSLLVLPFENLSGDPDQEWFADQITDDLTTDLSRISGSVVIAHIPAMTFQGKPVNVSRIGHDLDVRYVVEGSVRRAKDQVTVSVRLIDTARGALAWTDRFETDMRSLAEIQRDITGRLAHSLDLQLVEVAGRQIDREKDRDPLASDLVMRGWYLWFRPLSAATHDEAVRSFRHALELDPQSVEAKVGIATILISNIGTGLSGSPQQDSAQAEKLLVNALEQDPNNSRAQEALGVLRRIQNRLDESRVALETAIAIDRNNAHAMLQLGHTLMFLGRPDDAIPMINASIRLNPRDPNAAFGDWALGACRLLLGQTDQAVDLLRRARDENPRVYYFHIYLAGALGLRGDLAEARVELEEVQRLKPAASSLAGWQTVQPWIGNPGFMGLRAKTIDVGLRQAGMPAA